ncbi:MAG: hypothetical protein U9P42_10160 [Candidatus Fermentibacteria bacterium]|nr:hypothetical protein [Candidatus Fermentibacteria bacterium]
MAKLSDIVKKIDKTAKDGDREKALKMLDNLLKKIPEAKAQPILKRRKLYKSELATENRIIALEKQYNI